MSNQHVLYVLFKKIYRFFLVILTAILLVATSLFAKLPQSNFSFVPLPIVNPGFNPKETDYSLTVYVVGKTVGATLSGGIGGNLVLRLPFSETTALNGQIGFLGFGGRYPPFVISPKIDSTEIVIEGNGEILGLNIPISLNMEVELVSKDGKRIVIFSGPNTALTNITILTPYHIERSFFNRIKIPSASTNFKVVGESILYGFQFGAQGMLPVGNLFSWSPFFMIATQTGKSLVNFVSGYNDVNPLTDGYRTNIPVFTTISIGSDFVPRRRDFSLGIQYQLTTSAGNNESTQSLLVHYTWLR